MLTLEKVGWIAVILGLIIAVTAAIVVPIYDKAKEQSTEIDNIQFEESYYMESEYRVGNVSIKIETVV